MQPEEVNKPATNSTTPPVETLETAPPPKKRKQLAKTAALSIFTVAVLLFMLTPRSNGHGATQSSRQRAEQRQAEITRALDSENQSTDDASDNNQR